MGPTLYIERTADVPEELVEDFRRDLEGAIVVQPTGPVYQMSVMPPSFIIIVVGVAATATTTWVVLQSFLKGFGEGVGNEVGHAAGKALVRGVVRLFERRPTNTYLAVGFEIPGISRPVSLLIESGDETEVARVLSSFVSRGPELERYLRAEIEAGRGPIVRVSLTIEPNGALVAKWRAGWNQDVIVERRFQ